MQNFPRISQKTKLFCQNFVFSDILTKLIFNFAKLDNNLAKHEIKNFAKISRNYENENFAATLLLHNLPSATYPPLPSARRFFNAVWQCYFEMKPNKGPCFSILSFIILWYYHNSLESVIKIFQNRPTLLFSLRTVWYILTI